MTALARQPIEPSRRTRALFCKRPFRIESACEQRRWPRLACENGQNLEWLNERLIQEEEKQRKAQPITNLIRARVIPAVVSPLCAMAWAANGETYVTAPIVTPTAYVVRTITQTDGGTTCTATLNVIPPSSLDGLTGRLDVDGGIQATTRGLHEADGTWTLKATSSPYAYELLGTTYDTSTSNSWDGVTPGSMFEYGRLHVGTDIDASVELNWMLAWGRTNSPVSYKLPIGGLGILEETIVLHGNSTFEGHGGQNTFFWVKNQEDLDPVADRDTIIWHGFGTNTFLTESPDIYGNVSQLYINGFTIFGNRGHQIYGAGMHAFDPGDDQHLGVPISIVCEDFHVVGSAGYGSSLRSDNFKADCEFIRCTFRWSDGDNFDTKNRLDENDRMLWRDCKFGYHALGSQGTNLKPPIPLSANKFTTVGAGLSTVQVARSIDSATITGEVWTVKLAGMLDGINLDASPRVTAVDSSHITLDYTPQVATVGGVTGGSNGATVSSPHISLGDCLVDCRGHRFRVLGAVADSEFFARNGFRQRGGVVGDPNGEGGTDCMFRDLHGTDRAPMWIVDTNSEGRGFVTILGTGASVIGVRFTSMATANGIATGAQSERYSFTDFQITGGAVGIQCRGNRGRFVNGLLINQRNKGIEVYGKTATGGISLPVDPFTPAALGSAVVNVHAPAHGKTTGATGGFAGTIPNGNNVTILGSNAKPDYLFTVDDPDHYHFTASGSNTDATLSAWGGDAVQVVYQSNTPNTAYFNTFIGVHTKQTDVNTCIAWSIGKSDGNPDGRATGTRIIACEDHGSDTHWEDEGDSTDWAGLNKTYDLSGNPVADPDALPNNIVATTVTAAGLVTAGWQIVGTYSFGTDGASASIEFHTLAAYRDIKLVCFSLTHGDGSSRNWQVQVSQDNSAWKNTNGDYARSGVSAGTNALVFCGSVAAATPASGIIEIDLFNQANIHSCRINGGADNSSTGAQSQMGYVTAAAALQAVRIVNSGGVNTTGGTVYCLGKV